MRQPYVAIDISTYRGQWGHNFRRLRMKQFTTQQEFANALADQEVYVNKNTISNWELGIRTLPIECLPAIARVLRCDITELVPRYVKTGPDVESTRYDPKPGKKKIARKRGRNEKIR